MPVDEELLKPSREHLDNLNAKIKSMEAATIRKINRYGHGDGEYARQQWREYYRAIEPMRRERDAVGRLLNMETEGTRHDTRWTEA